MSDGDPTNEAIEAFADLLQRSAPTRERKKALDLVGELQRAVATGEIDKQDALNRATVAVRQFRERRKQPSWVRRAVAATAIGLWATTAVGFTGYQLGQRDTPTTQDVTRTSPDSAPDAVDTDTLLEVVLQLLQSRDRPADADPCASLSPGGVLATRLGPETVADLRLRLRC